MYCKGSSTKKLFTSPACPIENISKTKKHKITNSIEVCMNFFNCNSHTFN